MATRRTGVWSGWTARWAAALALLLAAGLAGNVARAAVPRLLDAQGVIFDAAGEPADGVLTITFGLYAAAEGGTALWSEVEDVAVSEGLFTTVLGDDPLWPFPPDLFEGAGELWLEFRVEAEPPLPRQRLVSVPFAMEADHAAAAETAGHADAADVADSALALDCAACIGMQHLTFVPASQSDLQSAVARIVSLETGVSELESSVGDLGAAVDELDIRKWDRPSCSLDDILVSEGEDWGCRSDWVSTADLDAALPTSVDGLAGGTITGDTTVTGTLAATELRQAGNVVCDASGNCGQTLANIQCDTDQVLRYDGAEWVCGDPPAPPAPCNGPSQVVQWDGSAWSCADIRTIGPSGGGANGWEIRDTWGFTWDAVERGAATWQDASETCAALGGRLPTVTELWRSNATTGTGNIGTVRDNSDLWTLIANYEGNYQTVRVSDGTVSAFTPTSTHNYRCVWPDHTSAAFDGDNCFGTAGASCVVVKRFYHMDAWDRPALDAVAASHECNYYNASIPLVADWTEAIHEGRLGGTGGNTLWAGGVMYYGGSSYILHALVQFSPERASFWAFDSYQNTFGSWNWPTAAARFRCIGKRSAAEGVDPSPTCQGGCFSIVPSADRTNGRSGRRAPIWADSANRTATTRAGAAAQCEAVGGSLPNAQEFAELVHAGLPFDTSANEQSAYLWSATPVYRGNYQNLLLRRSTSADPATWYPGYSGTASWDAGNGTFGFRCVWHQTFAAAPVTCAADEVLNWDGAAFSCAARRDGNDGGHANGGAWADAWGNVWDSETRAAATEEGARRACEDARGRLPTATELYRIRTGGSNPAPNVTTAYLWTNLPSYRSAYRAEVRLSDGAVSDAGGASATAAFRCVWPTTIGTAFGGNACAALPTAPGGSCFQSGHLLFDAANRVPIYAASAAEECRFYGGALADLRDTERLVHGGAPNGDWSRYSWVVEPMYSSYYRLALFRWSGVGTADWYWNNQVTQTASLDYAHVAYPFRCVFGDVLR